MITAVAGGIVGLMGAITAMVLALRVNKTTTEVLAKQDTLVEKVAEVHELTNSRLSRLEEQLRATQQELKEERAASSKAETVRATLAGEAAAQLPRPEP